jgi:hypothetical protein
LFVEDWWVSPREDRAGHHCPQSRKVEQSERVPFRLHLAASNVRAGRMEEAQCEVEEIRTISPDETLDLVKKTYRSQTNMRCRACSVS